MTEAMFSWFVSLRASPAQLYSDIWKTEAYDQTTGNDLLSALKNWRVPVGKTERGGHVGDVDSR
jgi:hypothetical protein